MQRLQDTPEVPERERLLQPFPDFNGAMFSAANWQAVQRPGRPRIDSCVAAAWLLSSSAMPAGRTINLFWQRSLMLECRNWKMTPLSSSCCQVSLVAAMTPMSGALRSLQGCMVFDSRIEQDSRILEGQASAEGARRPLGSTCC